MVAEIVVAGREDRRLIRDAALPITKVTAMVSPSARPSAEHDAADDAGPGIGKHHMRDDLVRRAADAIGRLLEHGRNRLEHVARDRGDEGQYHDREDHAGGQHADAVRRPFEERGQHRNVAERVDQERLHDPLQERREDEQAPDAVNDARDTPPAARSRCRSAGAATSGTVRSGTMRSAGRAAPPSAWR